LTKFSAGSGVPTLNRNDVHIQDISLPPLKEQEKIAEILTTWDKSITKQTELLRAKELLKIALMQKLLSGEVRFDGFSDEWEEVRLGEIGQIVTGTTPPTDTKAYYENGQFPWITPTDINDKKDICKSERYLTSLGLEKGRFIPKGSLLVTCIASIGKNAILTVDGSCNQQINAILPSEKNNINYLYYFIEYKKDYLIKFAGQSATQILNKKSFSSLKIKLPSLSEQQKIAEVLSLADDEINLLKNELEELNLQKKALMQKLLTGEVRVKV
jgi:type I restriction enzyme S subunit